MKKIIKLLSLPMLSLVLVACGNENKPAETTTAPETTTVAQTTVAQVSTPNDTTTADESSTGDETTVEGQETTESDAPEVAASDVPVKLYVDGELVKEFVAANAVDGSILDAMESIEDLDFVFDEAEGIVSTIDGNENNYDEGKTWVYLLNGEYAEYGVVSQTLSEGDVVEWYYGLVEDLPVNILPE